MTKKLKILIVEDDANTRSALIEYFGGRGYIVRAAEDGAEALAVGKAFDPALVISDWILPGPYDGVDVLEKLQEIGSQPKAIMMTAMPLEKLRKRCRTVAVSALLQKPIRLRTLRDAVNTALG